MSKRRRLSTRDRAALFERDNGICHMCGLRIEAGQEWEASHRIPLACGGADDMSNLSPAHKRCHRERTSDVDQPWIAKVRHQRDAHTGARVSKTPLRSGNSLKRERREPKRLDRSKICAGPSALARRFGIQET